MIPKKTAAMADASSALSSATPPGAENLEADILIADDRWHAISDVEALVRAAVVAAFTVARSPKQDEAASQACEVSILLEADAALHALNKQWRNKDKPTNVLSFPGPAQAMPGMPRHLGDLALSFDTLMAEADSEQKPLADHLQHLVVHGMLHLHGYDHEEAHEAEEMEDLERSILAGLGVPDPYAQ